MSDNKNKQDGPDRARVVSNEPSEVEYLHQQFPNKTNEQIKTAIKYAGPLRRDIERYLR